MPAQDPGLQNERTALAWRRTAFSVAVVGLAMVRLSFHDWGPAAAVWALVTMPAVVLVLVGSSRSYSGRYLDAHRVGAGVAVLATGSTVVVLGLLGAVFLWAR
ncbi:DUF202 domain-containing protein [Nocardioides bruguierae]|uniref:DUF202 domain-containing protein n=1 Tax=Nocardioides bruguierae TaxID=2945102 RepID=UPI00202E4D28|nr:DUF202 domain-containing protein [Nocardioides bruguierae]